MNLKHPIRTAHTSVLTTAQNNSNNLASYPANNHYAITDTR